MGVGPLLGRALALLVLSTHVADAGYYYDSRLTVEQPFYNRIVTQPMVARPIRRVKEVGMDLDDLVTWFVRDGGTFITNLINPFTLMLILGFEAAQASDPTGTTFGPFKEWSKRVRQLISESQAERVLPKLPPHPEAFPAAASSSL